MLSLHRASVVLFLVVGVVAGSAACGGGPSRVEPPVEHTPPAEPAAAASDTPALDVPPPEPPLPPAPADAAKLRARRIELLEAGNVAEATRTCRTWLSKPDDNAKAEAHKCLANVFVHQAEDTGGPGIVVSDGRQPLGVGARAALPRFAGEEITEAIAHLDKAAELNPTDASIHEGRLFLCLASAQYERALASLELSMTQYENAEAETWLQYMRDFPRSAAKQASRFATMIVQAHPEHPAALRTLGAWQTVTGETEEAKANLTKAIALAPRDAMAHWRLGELLALEGDRAGAKAAYRKSVKLGGAFSRERSDAYKAFTRRKPNR